MNIEQAKAIPMPEFLRKLGFLPVKQKGDSLLYFSPFRIEQTASFKVNSVKNVWYDFGEGRGGDLISFVTVHLERQNEDHTIADALRFIENINASVNYAPSLAEAFKAEQTATLTMVDFRKISSSYLVEYLIERRISEATANEYLKEAIILNSKTGKEFHALGWKNESDGYEVRNKHFKGCVKAKGITFIRGSETQPKEVHLFEGMFDFLSAFEEKGKNLKGDVIILNSVACVSQAIAYIKSYPYSKVSTWFDNDTVGTLATKTMKEFAEITGKLRFQGQNKTYATHKDVNAWHVSKMAMK